MEGCAGKRGRAAALGFGRVREGVENDLVAAGTHVKPHRDRVAHCPRGQEDSRLLTEQRGDPFLEGDHRRVGAALLVPDLSLDHRTQHLGRRHGLGIAEQV